MGRCGGSRRGAAASCASEGPRYTFADWDGSPAESTRSGVTAVSAATSATHGPAVSVHRGGDRDAVVVALCENRAFEVGLAACNLRTLAVTLMQYGDSPTFPLTMDQLARLGACEVLTPATTGEGPFADAIAATFRGGGVLHTLLARRCFNDSTGLAMLRSIAADPSCLHQLTDRYLCTAAAMAVIKFTESIQNTLLAPKSINVRYCCLRDRMSIDRRSVSVLRLVEERLPVQREGSDRAGSLAEVIDRTLTRGGRRLLRSNLSMPITCRDTLRLRQRCVSQLAAGSEVRHKLRHSLTRIKGDFDRLLAHFSHAPKQVTERTTTATIQHTLGLLSVLQVLPSAVGAIEELCDQQSVGLFEVIRKRMTGAQLDKLTEFITCKLDTSVLQDGLKQKSGPMAHTVHAFAVLNDGDGLLDSFRKLYALNIEEVHRMCSQLKEDHDIPSLRVIHNPRRGYLFGLDRRDEPRLVSVFTGRSHQGRTVTCTTLPLMSLNVRIKEALMEIMHRVSRLVEGLVEGIRECLGALHRTCDALSLLDLLQSMATYVAGVRGGCCVPEFNTKSIRIRGAKHPLLEGRLGGKECQANDVEVSPDRPFVLVTGPNNSGKSTYLSLVGVTVVLAHIGCPVPAVSCDVCLVDAIYTRMGMQDSMVHNASTFQVEMREMAHITERASPSSLVLVDELGRGTSHTDGAAVAWASAEWLVSRRCLVFFVTHFSQLNELRRLYPGVELRRLAVETDGRFVRPQFRIADGPCDVDRYGIKIAECVGLPKEVIAAAERGTELLAERCLGRVSVCDKSTHLFSIQDMSRRLSLYASVDDEARRRELIVKLREELIEALEAADDSAAELADRLGLRRAGRSEATSAPSVEAASTVGAALTAAPGTPLLRSDSGFGTPFAFMSAAAPTSSSSPPLAAAQTPVSFAASPKPSVGSPISVPRTQTQSRPLEELLGRW